MEEQLQEKAVLVGLNITTNVKKIDDIDINESMAELKELVKAAGAEVLASVIQNKPARDAAYFIGKGKVEEIRDYCKEQVDTLWAETLRFENPQTYYVDLSQKLWDMKNELLSDYARK